MSQWVLTAERTQRAPSVPGGDGHPGVERGLVMVMERSESNPLEVANCTRSGSSGVGAQQ